MRRALRSLMPALAAAATWRELVAMFLVLVHLVVRDLLAGHRAPSIDVEKLTISPASRTARRRASTGQDSCRRPAKVIVVNQTCHFFELGREPRTLRAGDAVGNGVCGVRIALVGRRLR